MVGPGQYHLLQVRAELNEIAYGKWEGLTKEKVNQEYHDDYVSWLADPAWHGPTGARDLTNKQLFRTHLHSSYIA